MVPGRPAGSDHPARVGMPASDDRSCHLPGSPSFPRPNREAGRRPEHQGAGRSEDPHTITGSRREPIQTLKRAELPWLSEPGWMPLPNVLRLSCGAKSRSG